jgi:hypothetical protein
MAAYPVREGKCSCLLLDPRVAPRDQIGMGVHGRTSSGGVSQCSSRRRRDNRMGRARAVRRTLSERSSVRGLLGVLDFHAAAVVRAVAAGQVLRHDPFEAEPGGGCVERRAVVESVRVAQVDPRRSRSSSSLRRSLYGCPVRSSPDQEHVEDDERQQDRHVAVQDAAAHVREGRLAPAPWPPAWPRRPRRGSR